MADVIQVGGSGTSPWLFAGVLAAVAVGLYYVFTANATANTGDNSTLHDSTVAGSSLSSSALNTLTSDLSSLFVPNTQYAGQGQIGTSDMSASAESETLQNLIRNLSGVTGAWYQKSSAAPTESAPTGSSAGSHITFDNAADQASANNIISSLLSSGAYGSAAAAVNDTVFTGESGTTPSGNTIVTQNQGGISVTYMT